MVEVLVALLVLSIGLLGLAALQIVGLQYNRQSYQRTQAVLQAYDIIDRIRANPTGNSNGDYSNVALGNGANVTPSTDCTTTTCTPDQLATYDIDQWNTMNSQRLTNGQGSICLGTFNSNFTSCAAGGSVFNVAITWMENNINQSTVVQVQP